jgi:hypothetical protein
MDQSNCREKNLIENQEWVIYHQSAEIKENSLGKSVKKLRGFKTVAMLGVYSKKI